MRFLYTTVRRQGAAENCVLRILVFSVPRLRSGSPPSSIDMGFADPMYAVNCDDHSGQSLCSPENVGALPIVRVSTRSWAQLRRAVACRAEFALLVSGVSSAPPYLLSAELLRLLKFPRCCFVIGRNSFWWFVTLGPATTFGDLPLVPHFPGSNCSSHHDTSIPPPPEATSTTVYV